VRWIVSIALLLFATCWLACEIEAPASALTSRLLVSQWRRTVDGWERLVPAPPAANAQFDIVTESHPHPIILSLLEGMISVFVLVAFSSDAVADGDMVRTEPLATTEADTQSETDISLQV
jgi:hypothetical protein